MQITSNATLNDLVPSIADADPNGLAIAYTAAVETGQPDAARFLEAAEKALTEHFMELKGPVLERLYVDLITRPIFPGRPPSNPLTRTLQVWGRHGDVYKGWADTQLANRGLQPQAHVPTLGPRNSEWADLPGEFFSRTVAANAPSASVTTMQQRAANDAYAQRFRQFRGLPCYAQVEFDPDLDFTIRVALSQKMASGGPVGTVMGVAALLKGGSPEEVIAAMDLGGALDGMNLAAGYATASDPLINRDPRTAPAGEYRAMEEGQGTMPLPAPFMRKCHLVGSRRYATLDRSRNSWLLAIVSLGDGWHNNHHHYPHAAQAGFFWWETDASYCLIKLLAHCGLIWGVRVVPSHKLRPTPASGPSAQIQGQPGLSGN
jgi:hypothetical protein